MQRWLRSTSDGCTVEVRVVPRSSRADVTAGPAGLRVRVHAPAEGGRATREAASRLADALGVPRSRVSLRSGPRSRSKVFAVRGLTAREAADRLAGTG
jgi:hypothetical protein